MLTHKLLGLQNMVSPERSSLKNRRTEVGLKAGFWKILKQDVSFLYSHSKGNNIYGKIHVAESLFVLRRSVFMSHYKVLAKAKASVTAKCLR